MNITPGNILLPENFQIVFGDIKAEVESSRVRAFFFHAPLWPGVSDFCIVFF